MSASGSAATPREVPKLGGVYRADGESWETYARRLEVRIKEQRDLLQHLNSLKAEWADRHDRRRIVRMERALGRVTEKWQYEREARISLVEKVKQYEDECNALREAVEAVEAHCGQLVPVRAFDTGDSVASKKDAS